MHKFLYSIAQNLYNYEDSFNYDLSDSSENYIICDDFKRVELKGLYQTFHVDCQGYDIDGSDIFTADLKRCAPFSDNLGQSMFGTNNFGTEVTSAPSCGNFSKFVPKFVYPRKAPT